jgi:hypothetical protein
MDIDALNSLLNGKPLESVIDIRTLLLDQLKTLSLPEFAALFWEKLPDLPEQTVRHYLYMNRD